MTAVLDSTTFLVVAVIYHWGDSYVHSLVAICLARWELATLGYSLIFDRTQQCPWAPSLPPSDTYCPLAPISSYGEGPLKL